MLYHFFFYFLMHNLCGTCFYVVSSLHFYFLLEHSMIFSFIAVPFLICVHNYFSELLDRRLKTLSSNFIILEFPLLKEF